ncbi:MAG: sugar kinase [Candidatus Omnitrophota bacterium]|nr:MAG: sugar kinase [Candidatus Omnitrophota bacterium]
MSILVVGTVALDTVQTPFGKVKNALGGSASYSALSASFFSKVKLSSIVGSDFPQEFITLFQRRGIDTEGLDIKKGKTFRWSGFYSYDLNTAQTLKTELNLLSHFNPDISGDYQDAKFVLLANISPHVQLEVIRQLKGPRLIVCDTMNYWIEHEQKPLKQVIKKSDILILNNSEARELTQESNLIKAGKALLALGVRLVIVKKGEYGCSLFSRGSSFSIPAYLLENVLDPTGAGDTFAGGFLGYLAACPKITESSFKAAIVIGTIMSSYVVEDFSLNRLNKLKKEDIRNRFEAFQRMTNFSNRINLRMRV